MKKFIVSIVFLFVTSLVFPSVQVLMNLEKSKEVALMDKNDTDYDSSEDTNSDNFEENDAVKDPFLTHTIHFICPKKRYKKIPIQKISVTTNLQFKEVFSPPPEVK